jgi:plastocyanin
MNKISALLGSVLVVISAFLFLITFSGGTLLNVPITGTNPTANFLAFLFVIIFLPVGSGLAFYGYAAREPIMAAGSQVVYKGSSSLAKIAVALAVVAILLGVAAIAYAGTVTPTTTGPSTSSLQNQITGINSKLGSFATVNSTPSTVPLRVDWCNTDNTGEDRFCPANIVVFQGDTVQILFIHNDTDAHTFTILPSGTSGYSFQINLTYGAPGYTTLNVSGAVAQYANGMHNFITNGNYTGSCDNSGTLAQLQAGVSSSYCVSGASLLAPASFMAINPNPASPLALDGGVILANVTNTAFFPSVNISSAIAGITHAEAQGSGAFQATQPGIYEYFCHYHVSNGMFGYLIVLPNSYCTTNAKACGLS